MNSITERDLVLSLILTFTGKKFIFIGDLAFGGRTPVMVLVLIEIADAFIDRRNNLTQLNKDIIILLMEK